MKKAYLKISKYLSFILRHHPEKANIELDFEGFADLQIVLDILNARYKNLNLGVITKETIQEIINQSDKLRFEIRDDKIRAYYGHSIDDKIRMVEIKGLPNYLYHGTTLKAWQIIKREGLKSQKRQYVHLSEDIETAKNVGKRRTEEPILLVIDVKSAMDSNIKFYKSGDMYLADHIPARFISQIRN